MSNIINGRYTATTDEPFVVFLIGMRVNKFFAFRKWWTISRAMGPMIETLTANPAKGLLAATFWMGWRSAMLVQYWRSFEDLEHFARNADDPHARAWRDFNRMVGSDGSVGIWHETYRVEPGNFESMYVNMPVFGLAEATGHVAVSGWRETARGRLNTATPIRQGG